MGEYISGCAERKTDSGWEGVNVTLPWLLDYQDYGYFGWIGEVRNYSRVSSGFAGRGIPDNASAFTLQEFEYNLYTHSASYVTVEELLAIDYSQLVEDRRVTREISPGHHSGACTCDPGEGEMMTLEEFLCPDRVAEIRNLPSLGVDRLVFWFH